MQISGLPQDYALKNAIASVEIEGFVLSEEEKRLCLKALNGDITQEQFLQRMLERCCM